MPVKQGLILKKTTWLTYFHTHGVSNKVKVQRKCHSCGLTCVKINERLQRSSACGLKKLHASGLCFYSSAGRVSVKRPQQSPGLLALREECCLYLPVVTPPLPADLLDSGQNQYKKSGTLPMWWKEKQQIHMISFLKESSSSLERL